MGRADHGKPEVIPGLLAHDRDVTVCGASARRLDSPTPCAIVNDDFAN
jgi:hypothetical protein